MNRFKLAFEQIREVRNLVKSGDTDQAIQIAQELLKNDYIPAFSRRYLEYVINSNVDRMRVSPKINNTMDTNGSVSGAKEECAHYIHETSRSLIQNRASLIGILNDHNIRLIHIAASLDGRIDLTAIASLGIDQVSLSLNNADNNPVCGEVVLREISSTSQEIEAVFTNIAIDNRHTIEVKYSLRSRPHQTISVRSEFVNLLSFCPVALACGDAKRPKCQDISSVNLDLLRYDLATRTNRSLTQEGQKLYCVDVRDTSLSVKRLNSKGPSLYDSFDIEQLESLLQKLESDSVLLLKDSSILLREDISHLVESILSGEGSSSLEKAILLNHLIKSTDNDSLFFTNYESIRGFCCHAIPGLNVRVKTCLLSVELLLDTIQQMEATQNDSLEQNDGSCISMILNRLIETNKASFCFKHLIGIQYLPPIPAEEKRLCQQVPYKSLKVDLKQIRYVNQTKNIGIISLGSFGARDIEEVDRHLVNKVINIENFTTWIHHFSAEDESPETLHHGQILIDGDRLSKAIRLSGVSYVSFIHPHFDLHDPSYFNDQVILIQSLQLCVSVSPHIYERRSPASEVTKIILGESFEYLHQACARVTPDCFPIEVAKGLIPISVPPLVGSLFDAEHLVKSLSNQALCSTRDIQALLSVEAHLSGYRQILSNSFRTVYTSKLSYSLFNSISEEITCKVNRSGALGNLPLICTSFKAKHD